MIHKHMMLSAVLYFSIASCPVKATDPVTLTVIGSFLAPILEPIAKEVVAEAAKGLVSASKKLSQKSTRCKLCNKTFACKVGPTFSSCKNDCQEVVQIGGYEIRLRFGEGWNLSDCVRKGVSSGLQGSEGKGNPRSIAIYSEEDLDHLKTLIGYKVAAEKVVATGGANIASSLNTNDPSEKKEKINQAVKEARDLIKKIDDGIQSEVRNGRYGNQ